MFFSFLFTFFVSPYNFVLKLDIFYLIADNFCLMIVCSENFVPQIYLTLHLYRGVFWQSNFF